MEGSQTIVLHLDCEEGTKADIVVPVIHENDDAEEGVSGDIDLNSGELELTYCKSHHQTVGIRFQSLAISANDKVEAAYLQFHVNDQSSEPTFLEIYGQATDNAARFTTQRFDISSRNKTKAVVAWQPKPWNDLGSSGIDHRTPNLAPVLQEIVNRSGWEEGRAVAFLIRGLGKRVAKAFRNDGKKTAATLFVELEDTENHQGVHVPNKLVPLHRYTVRLYFSEPNENASPGDRVFHVLIQGKMVLENFDVLAEAKDSHQSIVKQFTGVGIAKKLTIKLVPKTRMGPVLSGAEITAEIH